MIALYIIGGILLLLLLLLFTPAGIQASYLEGRLSLYLRWGPLRYNISPDKPRKPKKPGKAKAKKKQPGKEPPAEKTTKPTLGERWNDIRALLRASKKALRTLARHLLIDKLTLRLRLAGEDAHLTALLYGRVAAAVAVATEIADELFRLKKPDIVLTPDWSGGKTTCSFTVRARIRPWFVITAAVHLLAAYLKRPGKTRNTSRNRKGGNQHEPTASHR